LAEERYARDTSRDGKIGRIMAIDANAKRVWLRPPHGGQEWEALADDLQPLSPEEQLRVAVKEANRRSDWNRHVRQLMGEK
jgi:hypothetical protein